MASTPASAPAPAPVPASVNNNEAVATRWDRQRWISVFSSHNPTIREVTESLGLALSRSSSTTNRGIPKFENSDYRKLSVEVARLSKTLPKERDALVDFAAQPDCLEAELEALLASFGPAIWGRDADRSCLLQPDPSKKTYSKDLFFEDPNDRDILKIHLQRWIIIKACYCIRNMKLKRTSAANEYDTLADMEGDDSLPSPKPHLSPNGTPMSVSPPAEGASTTATADSSNKPIASKKRKSSVFNSLSDGDDMASPLVKRPYQSHTLPKSRNSPRKSLQSIAGSPVSENTPPVSLGQSPLNGHQPKPGPTSTPEPARALLTPLSSNDLNGSARPANPTSAANGFTSVNNAAGFTPVNTSPRSASKEPRSQTSAPSQNSNYASPYEAKAQSTSPAQGTQTLAKAPPLNTSASAHGFQAINSPAGVNGTNGLSTRTSPLMHHNAHIQPKPSSRSNTPVYHHHHVQQQQQQQHHHHHRPSLAPQRNSRSNTPIASAQPILPGPDPAHAAHQVTSAPAVQLAPSRIHHVTAPQIIHPPGVVHYAPPVQAVLKSHPAEAVPNAAAAIDLNLMQCEVLGLLMQYLFPKSSSPPDEALLLHRMEQLWHLGAAHFHAQIGPLYDLQTKILYSWISERRLLSQLRCSVQFKPGVTSQEMVHRLLAINDFRVMRLKWKNMSSAEGLSAEDLLCRTFAVVTNTEGTEYLFKDGLDRLNDNIFEFLRGEDMRILVHKRNA